MADILFRLVAEKIQFGLVRPKNSAITPHPVHADGRIIDKVTEFRFAPPKRYLGVLALRNFCFQAVDPFQSLIGSGGEFAKGTHDPLVLCIKLEALVMSDGPNRSYRFVSDVEWNEQHFDNWRCDRRRDRIIPFRV